MYQELLFMDFDGTYWPRSSANPRLMETFSQWVLQRNCLGIVISSNWRFTNTLEELKGYFHESIETRVFDMLALEDERSPAARQSLIEQFVRQYASKHGQQPSTLSWVALDDSESLFQPHCPRLVLCDYSSGMTEQDLQRASLILQSQRNGVLS